jgi:hypothetical protein
VAGKMVGAHLRHLEERRDKAVRDAAMRHAFADRIDPRVEGLHRVVHDNAFAAVEARVARQLCVRPDADRHHDQLSRDLRPVLEAHRGNPAGFPGDELGGLCLQKKSQALRLERGLQHPRGRAVELALHQPGHEVHDGHLHPPHS